MRNRLFISSVAACAALLALLPSGRPVMAALQDSAPADSAPVKDLGPGPYVSPRNYRIAPDDSLEIRVVNHQSADFTQSVDPDGTINYPHANGPAKVVGLTAQDVERMVIDILTGTEFKYVPLTTGGVTTATIVSGKKHPDKAYYLHPEVRVYVRARQGRSINVIGTAIRSVGRMPYREGSRIFDALASAGFTTDRPDFFEAKLFRAPAAGSNEVPKVLDVDLARVLAQDPNPDPNNPGTVGDMVVLPEDTLIINAKDETRTTIQVIGQVAKPGLTTCPRDGSLVTVLGTVQPNPKALLSAAKVERNGQEIPVDLSEWFKDGKVDTNLKLQPGDRLIIPENQRYYSLFGPTGHSGTLVYPDDRKLTLLSAWADAGGQTQGLELNKVQVIRPSATGGKPLVQVVNLKEVVKSGKLQDDVPIQPGDIIYMPPSNKPKGVPFFQALSMVSLIPTLALLTGHHL